MIRIVELVPDEEFADLGPIKAFYLDAILGGLSSRGYAASPIDLSELYSFERMILLDTNAPGPVVDSILRDYSCGQDRAFCVLVT